MLNCEGSVSTDVQVTSYVDPRERVMLLFGYVKLTALVREMTWLRSDKNMK